VTSPISPPTKDHSDPQSAYYGIVSEKALLGTVLMFPKDADELLTLIGPEDFFVPDCRKAWAALQKFGVTELDDLVRLKVLLARECAIGEHEAAELIGDWWDNASIPSLCVLDYIPALKRFTRQRKLLVHLSAFKLQAEQPHFDVLGDVFESNVCKIVTLADEVMRGEISTSNELCAEMEIPNRNEIEAKMVPTGLPDLSAKVDMFAPGRLTIIGGRTSMGKSSLMREIVFNASATSLLFIASIEEPNAMVSNKLVCMHAGIEYNRFEQGFCDHEEQTRLLVSCAAIASRPIEFMAARTISPTNLRITVKRRISAGKKPRAVFVDYLGLMAHAPASSRQEQISESTRALKMMAEELDVAVVCLAQVNRNAEGRDDGRPRLSDLRESGAIEQDADAVVFIWQEPGGNAHTPTIIRKLTLAKNRHGATVELSVLFDREKGRIHPVKAEPMTL